LETSPIPTKENFADLETKKLSADRMRYLMHGVGVYDESAGELVGTDVVTRERFFFLFFLFFFRARCLSAGLRSWVLLAEQRGIEPPPVVCQQLKSAAIPTEPRGRLCFSTNGIALVSPLLLCVSLQSQGLVVGGRVTLSRRARIYHFGVFSRA
jgi:hypothetical protein